ncbi:Carboxylesterase [Leucosporidium creatinivorum]|uniref:Carboxylic ester hydrolase n=1 Tax=Leucosporidium creatinivorum TaxID=106004 RepID=A0A1Y2FVL6_9BASI|nr:Carboxylesterase [Leucosporidium creatinivorum]
MLYPSSWITKTLLLAGIAVSSCDALAIRAVGDKIAVTTSKGSVSGYAGSVANRYVVPYAEAPIGARRFQDPVALSAFKAYDGSGLPPACPQWSIDNISEDCLFLSIYTPTGATSSSKLPVMFWIHGGSFYAGATTNYGLDGSELANAQNMIVVTVQYRLGLLGFMKNDGLRLSGNYGLKDVIMALNYVKTEIKAFGGDPSRVTLAGQSSGAELIKTLLVTPSATSLFARAILQSAPLDSHDQTIAVGNSVGVLAASYLDCTTLACLKSASVDSLLNSQAGVVYSAQANQIAGIRVPESPIRPVVDGKLVTREFRSVVASGQALEGPTKPLIFTTMKDENALAISGLFAAPIPASDFNGDVALFFSERADTIINSGLYDPSLYSGDDATRLALTDVGTDFSWTCANQQTAINVTAAGQTVYQGQWNLGVSYTNRTNSFTAFKAAHQDDIYAVFNPTSIGLTRGQSALVKEVQARWGAFVKTGSPNSASYPTWSPLASGSNLNLLVLGNDTVHGTSATSATQRTAECAIGSGIYTLV